MRILIPLIINPTLATNTTSLCPQHFINDQCQKMWVQKNVKSKKKKEKKKRKSIYMQTIFDFTIKTKTLIEKKFQQRGVSKAYMKTCIQPARM